MRVRVIDTPELFGLRVSVVGDDDWETVAGCPLCGEGALVELGRVRGSAEATVTSACPRCELVFASRRPTEAWFDRFYAAEWDAAGREDPSRPPKANASVLEAVAARLPRRARVLDVGAGFGMHALAFRDAGHEVHAIERSEHRVRFLADRLGLPCSTSLDESRGFDLVYSVHVLEHVPEPAAFLDACAAAVADGGLLYVACPSLWGEYAPQAFQFAPHVSFFTPAALLGALAERGFSAVEQRADRELRVLAVKDGGARRPPRDPEFVARATGWAVGAFGPRGRRLLTWRKSRRREAAYEIAVTESRRLRRARPPRGWTKVRALEIEVCDEPAPPVALEFDCDGAPVWVK